VSAGAAARGRQAERSATTRARVLDAAAACIDEQGLARATHQRIARRAGVSVGAVQHHFASKAELFDALLARSAEELEAAFEGVDWAGRPLGERVRLFLERAWRHYGGARFRSTLALLVAERTPPPGLGESSARARRLWGRAFGEPVDADLLRLAFAALSGLALTRRAPGAGPVDAQLELLAGLLEARLTPPPPAA